MISILTVLGTGTFFIGLGSGLIIGVTAKGHALKGRGRK